MNKQETLKRKRVLKEIINQNFTFGDLSPKYLNVDSSTGNIFCPFHENHTTPAAKMYWDETRNIWILHCFGECHRNYTAYDYVDLILCDKYQKYRSPLDFLQQNFPANKLQNYIEFYEKQNDDFYQELKTHKINYINNTFFQNEAIAEYIEAIYTG